MRPDYKISEIKKDDVVLLGVPIDYNSSYQSGPALAPSYIRERLHSDSSNLCTETGIDLETVGNWYSLGDLKFNNSKESFSCIEKSIDKILDKKAKILSLGGDHSVTYPILKAYAKKYRQLTILHFDAHPDLYDELNGNKFSHASPFARIMEEKLADNIIQLGIRTLTSHQRDQVKKFNIKTIEMKDYTKDLTLDIDGPLYISFDMDALDPAFAPGVSHHEPGGFSTRQVLRIIQNINASTTSNIEIVGADIVEYNPLNDINSMTAMTAAKLVKEIIEKMLI